MLSARCCVVVGCIVTVALISLDPAPSASDGLLSRPCVVDHFGIAGLRSSARVRSALLKTDDVNAALPGIGEHDDDAWWTCVQTCKDPTTGKPTPELCSSLNPQPNNSWEVVAPQVGGVLDNFIYGANGSEWRQWMQPSVSGGKVTAIPTFNARQGGFSSGYKEGFLCEAHRQNIRVMDADTIGGIYSPYSLQNNDIYNETSMVIWAEAATHFMISAGIDGFSLDLESNYAMMASNATARAAFTAALVRLKARMQAVVPGSLLVAWVASNGSPWTKAFSNQQMADTAKAVDQFWVMDYAMCSFPPAAMGAKHGGMANAPMQFIEMQLKSALSLGIPASKFVAAFPWYNCNYDCGTAGNPAGGVNCTNLRPIEFCPGSHYPTNYTFCHDNYSNPGYAQTLPLLELGKSQGNSVQWDEEQEASFVNYFNKTDQHYHQVWYDDPKSLALKYQWAAKLGLGGVGMWTPSATLFNESASRAMWAVVPTKVEAAALRKTVVGDHYRDA